VIVLLDENFPLGLLRSLQNDGLSAQHIITLGWRGASDARIRERLQDDQVVFLTQHEDFLLGEASRAIVVLSRFNVIGKFRAVEDGMDAAVPVDAKNAPTRDLETTKQFPQRPHRSSFLQEEKEQRRTLQVCQSDCLNRGVHPSQLCPFLCPLSREFGATRYEESASANREFGSVPVNRTHSVRVSRGSCWSDC